MTGNHISVTERDSPFPHIFNNEVTIETIERKKISGYQIKVSEDCLYDKLRVEKFFEYKWKNNALACEEIADFFVDSLFTDESSANLFCFQNDITFIDIYYIELEFKTVLVSDFDKEFELELPIECNSDSEIKLNNSGYSYNGKLIVESLGDKMRVINRLDLEEYVKGVIPNEIGSNAPLEALKAQAVSARTQTIFKMLVNRHKKDGYTLCSQVHCQVYRGNYRRNENTDLAVDDTKAEILTYQNRPIDAVYSSSCGGRTESNQFVWEGRKIDYLQSRPDGKNLSLPPLKSNGAAINWIKSDRKSFCKPVESSSSWQKKNYRWEREVSRYKISGLTGVQGVRDIKILSRGESGRANKIEVKGRSNKIIKGEYNIRKALGGLPSSLFYVKKRNPFVFVGKGSGHGVGMCQTGTINMAKTGISYSEILKFYFRNCQIEELKITE